MKECLIPDCGRPVQARGYCTTHYWRLRKLGSTYAELPIQPTSKGGIRKHRLYGSWAGMVNRCHNSNHSSYPIYGGRGITVCDRWREDFRNFLADMGERPEGMTLDRIDPSGPYAPENCRWASPKEQRANQSEAGKRRQRDGASAAAKQKWKQYRAANI